MTFKTPELQEAWDLRDQAAVVQAALDIQEPDVQFVEDRHLGMAIVLEGGVGLLRVVYHPTAAWQAMNRPEGTEPTLMMTWKLTDLVWKLTDLVKRIC